MNLVVNFSLAGNIHRSCIIADSLLTGHLALGGAKAGALAVAQKNGETHYTEENQTIPETPASQLVTANNQLIRNALNPANPGQVDTTGRAYAS